MLNPDFKDMLSVFGEVRSSHGRDRGNDSVGRNRKEAEKEADAVEPGVR